MRTPCWLRTLPMVLILGYGLPAVAAGTTNGTLESDLAPDIGASIIQSYEEAIASPAGLEPFEALYLSFETVRKWQAYLDAVEAAGLTIGQGPFANIKTEVYRLAAHGIDRTTIATAAIEKLAGVQDWRAANQAQAELVINQLGSLLTEIADHQQRVMGQLLLARVEMDAGEPQAARALLAGALQDLPLVENRKAQVGLGRRLADMVFALRDPRQLELLGELVASIDSETDRAALTEGIAVRLGADPRLAAKQVDTTAEALDPVASAWAYQVDRLSGGPGATFDAALARVGSSIDPLASVIIFSAGSSIDERRDACHALVDSLIRGGATIRALNLRKKLPASDCTPSTDLSIAADLASQGYGKLALSLASSFIVEAQQGYAATRQDLGLLAAVLVDTGAIGTVGSRSSYLAAAYGADGYAAMHGRAAVVALLNGESPTADLLEATQGYAPSMVMAGLLGQAGRVEETSFVAVDLDLLERVGGVLASSPDSALRLADFLVGQTERAARLALAHGLVKSPTFSANDVGPLAPALEALANDGGDVLLMAALGGLTPDAVAGASDDVLLLAARAAAWRGNLVAAEGFAQAAKAPEPIRLDIARIQAISGDFDVAIKKVRQEANAAARVRVLRSIAEGRLMRLDKDNWFGLRAQVVSPDPATLVQASFSPGQTVIETPQLTLTTGGAAKQDTLPPLPDLTVASKDVTGAVPYPDGGRAGVVVGGEGRYVRLARFESPSFEGQQNNGVRDYVYQQNKTITPEFIFLNAGTFTLADVIDGIGRQEADAITLLGDGVVRINRPIAVGPDATLILSGEEAREIQLNATLGAYIINAGRLYIAGTRIVGFDTERDGPAYVKTGQSGDKFRPFILSWSGSATYAADSEFVAMGYSAGRSYGFSLTSGPPDDAFFRSEAPAPTGIVVSNSFDNLHYGFYAYEAVGAQVVGNEYRDSVIYGIDPHDRSRALNMSLNATYGTHKKHGIIISREVNDSFIVGNLSFDNHGSGVMLDRASVGTVILGNTLRHNEGDGVSIFESPCTLVGMNDVSFNRRSGVLVRNSWDVAVAGNRIEGNKSTAVQSFISDLAVADGSTGRNFDVDPYQPFVTVSIRDNLIVANAAGIQTAGVSLTELSGNRFRYQSKRLFGGDLEGLAAALMQSGGHGTTTVSTSCRPVLTPVHACLLTAEGAVPAMMSTSFGTGGTGDYCLSDPASPHAQAFRAGGN